MVQLLSAPAVEWASDLLVWLVSASVATAKRENPSLQKSSVEGFVLLATPTSG